MGAFYKVSKYVFLLLVLAGFLVIPLSTGAAKGGPPGPDTWQWSKQNPKPPWWNWGKDYWPTEPVPGGDYQYAVGAYIGRMNPNHWPVSDWVTMGFPYEKLIYTDGNYRATVPWLAKSWEYEKPTVVIMKLREGIKFTDGSSFSAESVKFQFDWIMDKRNGAWSRTWLEPLKSVEVVDEYTVKWTFKRSWGAFAGVMANVPGWQLSYGALQNELAMKKTAALKRDSKKAKKKIRKKKLAKIRSKATKRGGTAVAAAEKKIAKLQKKAIKLEAEYAAAKEKTKDMVSLDLWAVGSGRYMVDVAKPGNYLKLKRNPNWWFGPTIGRPDMPYYETLTATVIPEASVRLANLKAGTIDSLLLDKSQYIEVKDDPKLRLTIKPGNHVGNLAFNHAEGPTKDIRVRKAVSHAIDRKALIQGVSFGFGVVGVGPFPTVHWCADPTLKPIKYDPELSKKLLAEAGYANGLTLRGWSGSSAGAVKYAQALKGMLAKVGINYELKATDIVSGTAMWEARDYDMVTHGWAFVMEPDLMMTGLYHEKGTNAGRSFNKAAQPLIEAGRAETDLAKRQQIYFKLARVLYDNYEDAWLNYYVEMNAWRKVIQGANNDYDKSGWEGYGVTHPTWFRNGKREE